MKILIALNHPAHYYLFKYIIFGLRSNGYEVKLVIRKKDILENILISEKQNYIKICEKKKRNKNPFSVFINGILELIIQNINLYKFINRYRPDYLLGTDVSIAHIGKLRNIPSFVFNEDDYEINKLFCKTTYPFIDYIIAPDITSVGKYTDKKISYNGIQKMTYLNSKYFKPDNSILDTLALKEDESFFIIRLVSLTSVHDIESKHNGINVELLRELIIKLRKRGRVFITTEDRIPDDLQKYQVGIAPNKMHDLMYYASLFIGDSQSMCAESGILGTPFIRFNDFVGKVEYLNDLENNYKLGWGVKTSEPEKVFLIIDQLFNDPNYKKKWAGKRDRLFKEKIDLTSFSIWLIENYPKSAKYIQENQDYQYNFKYPKP